MPSTFCSLLTAYLFIEFLFRSRPAEKRSRIIWTASIHGILVTLLSYLLLGNLHWRILLAVLVASTVMAAVETRASSGSVSFFVVSQCVILGVLLGLAWYFPDAATEGWWVSHAKPDLPKWYFAILTCASGLVACVLAGGVLIANLMRPFASEIGEAQIGGLVQGGRYIGWLERILIFLLVLTGQSNGIGFLIAAKSILRFGEIKEANQRKVAEYIIIGTFASFGWAVLFAALTEKAMSYWLK